MTTTATTPSATTTASVAHQFVSRAERSDLTASLTWRAHRATDDAERRAVESEIVRLNLRVARAVAARYRGRGIPQEDLEQVACEALVKAVQRFDPSRQHDLLSYAVPTMRGELLRHFRDHSWVVRPPRRLQELERTIASATAELGAVLGHAPAAHEICTHLGIGPIEHREAMQAAQCRRLLSLDQPAAGDSATTLGELVPDEVDRLAAADARAVLEPALRRLSGRDRRILYLRFVEDRTQREIGDELGVTQMQVSRWLTRICTQLRVQLGAPPGSERPQRQTDVARSA